jgi:uncharacterized Tic20 family protein
MKSWKRLKFLKLYSAYDSTAGTHRTAGLLWPYSTIILPCDIIEWQNRVIASVWWKCKNISAKWVIRHPKEYLNFSVFKINYKFNVRIYLSLYSYIFYEVDVAGWCVLMLKKRQEMTHWMGVLWSMLKISFRHTRPWW